jgi:hypothetical protein
VFDLGRGPHYLSGPGFPPLIAEGEPSASFHDEVKLVLVDVPVWGLGLPRFKAVEAEHEAVTRKKRLSQSSARLRRAGSNNQSNKQGVK